MFAQPHWFQRYDARGRLRPRTWQGWIHTLAWSAALAGPAAQLLALGRWPEAGIWSAVVFGLWRFDLSGAFPRPSATRLSELFVIDDTTDITRVTTDQFEIRRRG